MRELRLPTVGYALQMGIAGGFEEDGWVGKELLARFLATRPLSKLVLRGWMPAFFPDGNRIELAVGFWYPFVTMANFDHLDLLLKGENRYLLELAGDQPVADIGAADGDLAFFLEQKHGVPVHVIDHAPTNYNGMRGVRRMREA